MEIAKLGEFGLIDRLTKDIKPQNESTLKGLPSFCSPQEFIDYLKEIGLEKVPGRNTMYYTVNKTVGRYPNWTFSDDPQLSEELRRKNIANLFLSAFRRRL